MAHNKLREEAVALRKQGFTYGQIKRDLGIQKSTLSDWLSDLPLTTTQQNLLAKNKLRSRDLSREKFIETSRVKSVSRLKEVYQKQNKQLLPLSNRELFIAGLFLYWGEGEKRKGRVSLSNTDPRIIKFYLYWLFEILKVPKDKIVVRLQLYKDMNINESINFWSVTLDLQISQFRRTYIKKSNRDGLTYKSFGHGTCRIHLGDVHLSEKIAMSIKAISDRYGAKDEIFWYN
jgi:hypothetical protein